MLQELYHLAEREGLVGDPAFDVRPVAWIIELKKDGSFIGFSGTRYEVEVPPAKPGGKKPKPREEIKRFAIPRQFNPITGATRTAGAYAYFLVDKSDYVLGCGPEGKAFQPPSEKKIHHRLFIDKVRECHDVTKEKALEAVLVFLERVHAEGVPVDLPAKSSPGDLFAFIVRPSLDEFVHELPSVKEFWRKKCTPEATGADADRHCLITGKPVGETLLFPQIKKVPGAQASSGLVSFEMQAARSHGWGKSDNAPVSHEAAQAASVAMNRLLDPAYQKQDGTVLQKRHYRLSEDTVVCYWAKDAKGDETADGLSAILQADPGGKPGEIWRSIWRGKAPTTLDPTKFYAVTLTGAQGRAIVRDWYETTVGEVQESVAKYFEQLELRPNTFPGKGKDLPPHYSLQLILQSLAKSGKASDLPSKFSAGLFATAINRHIKFPSSLLAMALDRSRSEIGSDEWIDSYRRDARTALIKAILIRNHSIDLNLAMSEPNNSSGYLLGCLFACIERMQYLALGDQVNATITNRYFAAASINPRAVMNTLVRDLNSHYTKKAKRKKPGATVLLSREISQIMANYSQVMKPEEGFPARLSQTEQGLFVIGYHVQRGEFLKRREKDDDTADSASLKEQGHS